MYILVKIIKIRKGVMVGWKSTKKWLVSVVNFYSDGFSGMSDWARNLWIIILIKLFVIFFILKLFFFRDTLKNQFDNDQQRGEHVIEQITK